MPLSHLFGEVLAVILRQHPHHLLGEVALDACSEVLRHRDDRNLFLFHHLGQPDVFFQGPRNAVILVNQQNLEPVLLGVRQHRLILRALIGLFLRAGDCLVGIDPVNVHSVSVRKFRTRPNLRLCAHFRLIVGTEPCVDRRFQTASPPVSVIMFSVKSNPNFLAKNSASSFTVSSAVSNDRVIRPPFLSIVYRARTGTRRVSVLQTFVSFILSAPFCMVCRAVVFKYCCDKFSVHIQRFPF